MFIVVIYDIADDKLRTRLHKTLRRFGEAVQFSVFECILTAAQFAELRAAVQRVLGEEQHGIRYYDICETCRRRIVTLGTAQTTSLEPVYII